MTKATQYKQAATAAYASDSRADDWQAATAVSSGWHVTFDRLLASGHIFMGYRFSVGGLLFRGMPAGIGAALTSDCFWHSMYDNPLCRLERDLDVMFCSEVARDALSVARPWETGREDAAVLIFASDIFNRRWQERRAAALGFADVGMVFKYPCLADPFTRYDLLAILMHPQAASTGCKHESIEILSPARPDSRDAWQQLLADWLANQALDPATAQTTDCYPRRHGP